MNEVVNYKDVGGMTPLHRAARIGNTDLVQELLELKADVNAAPYPSRARAAARLCNVWPRRTCPAWIWTACGIAPRCCSKR